MKWQQRGAAVVSPATLMNGKAATIAVVGARNNPKGAAVLMHGATKGEMQAVSVLECLDLLHPSQVVETLAMQERLHGASGLKPPAHLADNP